MNKLNKIIAPENAQELDKFSFKQYLDYQKQEWMRQQQTRSKFKSSNKSKSLHIKRINLEVQMKTLNKRITKLEKIIKKLSVDSDKPKPIVDWTYESDTTQESTSDSSSDEPTMEIPGEQMDKLSDIGSDPILDDPKPYKSFPNDICPSFDDMGLEPILDEPRYQTEPQISSWSNLFQKNEIGPQ